MPVPKKRTTSPSEAAKVASSDHPMPDEQEFRQRMRNLAVSAMRVLIEEVMREELEMCLGAAWGESTPSRKGYRNGSYTRDLVTKTGRIEALSVPRDREGQFQTQVFERYGRYEPEVAQAPSAHPLSHPLRRTLIHFTVRHGTQTDSTIILTALGVDLEGNKEVLALRACAEEDKDGWSCLLQDLRNRGVA